MHECLESIYSGGGKVSGHGQLKSIIDDIPKLREQIDKLSPTHKLWIENTLLYWGLNELFYRQQVVKWLLDADVNFKIAGAEWEHLGKRSVGYIGHPDELLRFLSKGRTGLHLNSEEGWSHRRIHEINLAGRPCITRGVIANTLDKRFDPESFVTWMGCDIERILAWSEANHAQQLESNIIQAQETNRIYFYDPSSLVSAIELGKEWLKEVA